MTAQWALRQAFAQAVPAAMQHPATAALCGAMGTPPTPQRRGLINAFINRLVAASVWPKLDFLHVPAAADSQAALLNWKSPASFTALAVNAPAFVADRGFTGNGTNSYVDSTWAPNPNGVQFQRNAASIGCWCLTESVSAHTIFGSSTNTANASTVEPRFTGNIFRWRLDATTASSTLANSTSVGLAVGVRNGLTMQTAYMNGVNIGTDNTITDIGLSNDTLTFGKALGSFVARQGAMWFAGGVMNDTQVAALYAAALAYMQGVGAA